ncbi:MAG TPA: hypothetical protein VK577_13355 [Bradyrhizobium sp.]|nr:hypothetical protein [Bradyrhizobium sp.]
MNWTKIARCTAVAIGTTFVVAAGAYLVSTFSSSISDDPPRWNVSQVSALSLMHTAARLQFERAAREFAQWRAVPEDERSPAPV